MKTIKKLPSISALVLLATSAFFTLSCGGKDGEYDASGTFEATEIIVSSEANGKILSLDIVEGQQLEAGTPVGTIDSTQLYLKKRQLLTSVRGVEVRRPEYNKQIAATQQQIATQISEKARIERLVKAEAANQKQLDDINSSISVLQKQLEAQKSSLTTTTSGMSEDAAALMIQVDQLNDQLSKCRILSPIKGTVLVKYAEAGELTGSGKPLFKIADIENMILRAYITSDIITKLKLNQEVKVFADFGEKEMREYPGTIVWISDKAEFTPKTIQTKKERANLVYAVKIAVKNDGYIKIGMYGEVKI
ncbi:MAG: HlyD family secretion protein [Bacteroidales bacterium]